MKAGYLGVLCTAALLAACGGSDNDDDSGTPPPVVAPKAGSVIDRLEIVSTADAYNGAVPAGAAGPY